VAGGGRTAADMTNADVGVFRRLVNATRISINGLNAGWRTQPPLRYELYVLVIAVPAAWLLGNGPIERALMIGACVLVVVVELINSAIEVAVDRIGPERHELSGRAKDLASAAVFISIFLALMVWAILLSDRWLH
jgi:diacylglycerol kinase (ATP)